MPTKLALTSLLGGIVKASVQVLLETQLANFFFSRFGYDNAVDWLVGNWGDMQRLCCPGFVQSE